MGKKSKSDPAASEQQEDLPQWHASLPKATVEFVSTLPQRDHGWLCTIIRTKETDKTKAHGILAILDITNQVRGEGSGPRYMNLGPCPSPEVEADDIAKALMATMVAPQPCAEDVAEYYQPRRPAWVLLEKSLEPCLETVATILSSVDVIVKLNTPEALAEDPENPAAEDNQGRKATWDIGLAMGPTVENVLKLPQESEQVWKFSMTMLMDQQTGSKECLGAVEDITQGQSEEEGYPLGVGPCPPATVNPDGMVRALLATMLSPRKREGGYGEARRPGRILLDKPLEPWLEHVQSKLQQVELSVEIV
jgi:hypothetical protein